MMTVHEVSERTGVSVRALHHYDSIGLLKPAALSEAGYRLYDVDSLERLQLILLFRELEFPLKDIGRILDSPSFDRNRALEQQITLLKLRREHLDNLITLASGLLLRGMSHMSFEPFDTKKIDEYTAEARRSWGSTPAWEEYEGKRKGRSPADEKALGEGLMALLAEFHPLPEEPVDGERAQALVERLRDYITRHYYACTPQILQSLGALYAGEGRFAENIDAAGGPGTAAFAARAIEAWCERHPQ